MNSELRKAKMSLRKYLCFTTLQAEGIPKEELMTEEDIKILLSIEIKKLNLFHFPFDGPPQSLDLILENIQNLRKEGFDGMVLSSTIPKNSSKKIEEFGCLINYTGHGSVIWDEVFFSKKAFAINQIRDFKHLFGEFARVAPMIYKN